VTVCLLTFGALGTAPHVAAQAPELVWQADAELPLEREWSRVSCVSLDRIQRVASPRAQGESAYQITVADGDAPSTEDERCELAQGNGVRLPGSDIPEGRRQFGEGNERWIAFQVRVGDDWDANTPLFNNFLQLKNDGSGGPPLKMAIDNGRIELGGITRADKAAPNWLTLWSTPFTADMRNRWLRFLVHVRFSPDPASGFVALYGDLNGGGIAPLMPLTPAFTMKTNEVGEAIGSHARIGIYRHRDISGSASIWFDGFTVARTRPVAEAYAYGESVEGARSAGLELAESLGRAVPPGPPRVGARARDSRPPALRIGRLATQRLGRMLVLTRCDEPCKLRARLVLDREAARRLGSRRRPMVIGLGVARGSPGTVATLRLRPTVARKSRKMLRRVRRLPATLVVEAVDSAGNRRVVRRSADFVGRRAPR
jgi:Polysaccharide lyase